MTPLPLKLRSRQRVSRRATKLVIPPIPRDGAKEGLLFLRHGADIQTVLQKVMSLLPCVIATTL